MLDSKKVPQNKIEQIEKNTVRVNRKLKKHLGAKSVLDDKIKEEMTADTNGNVSVDQLREFVLKLCEQDLIDRSLSKKDVEGFLSAFNYNNYGATNINDISSLVFIRDDLIPDKLAERKRPNAPPSEIATKISFENVDEF